MACWSRPSPPPASRKPCALCGGGGTVSLVGLPPGEFGVPIFDVVLKRLTIRGSIVGDPSRISTEAIAFADGGQGARRERSLVRLDDINEVFARLRAGTVHGRAVLDLAGAERGGRARQRSSPDRLSHGSRSKCGRLQQSQCHRDRASKATRATWCRIWWCQHKPSAIAASAGSRRTGAPSRRPRLRGSRDILARTCAILC